MGCKSVVILACGLALGVISTNAFGHISTKHRTQSEPLPASAAPYPSIPRSQSEPQMILPKPGAHEIDSPTQTGQYLNLSNQEWEQRKLEITGQLAQFRLASSDQLTSGNAAHRGKGAGRARGGAGALVLDQISAIESSPDTIITAQLEQVAAGELAEADYIRTVDAKRNQVMAMCPLKAFYEFFRQQNKIPELDASELQDPAEAVEIIKIRIHDAILNIGS